MPSTIIVLQWKYVKAGFVIVVPKVVRCLDSRTSNHEPVYKVSLKIGVIWSVCGFLKIKESGFLTSFIGHLDL